MNFYHFRQNNSGGRFVQNDDLDVSVLIEANDAREANDLAERIGIYFDGVANDMDCECCGDRWHPVSDYDGKPFPHRYGEILEKNEAGEYITEFNGGWRKERIVIHSHDSFFK